MPLEVEELSGQESAHLQTRAFINTNDGEGEEERHEALGLFLASPVLHR